jgi:peptidoglycan/LPS O-acetylase OafA/YrhL
MRPSVSPAPESRSAVIDVLRGVAITLVLLLHFSLTYKLSDSPLAAMLTRDGVRALVNNGNYGVTMFFVVSGFLIASAALARYGRLDAIDRAEFVRYRAARILPSLLLVLGVIVALGLAGTPSFKNEIDGHELPAIWFVWGAGSVLTFTHNLLMESVGYFNYCLNIYWSLSVEEVFYLGFPLLCVAVRRDARVVLVCVVLVVAAPIYRGMHDDDELYFMYGHAACFDAIALGVLAALLSNRATPPRAAPGLALLSAGALAWAYLRGIGGHEAFGFTQIAMATAALLFLTSAGAGRVFASGRGLAPLRWAGRHSYELYLFHLVVLALMRDALPRNQLGYGFKLPWLVVFVALSAMVAAVVARWISEPANAALRRRRGLFQPRSVS